MAEKDSSLRDGDWKKWLAIAAGAAAVIGAGYFGYKYVVKGKGKANRNRAKRRKGGDKQTEYADEHGRKPVSEGTGVTDERKSETSRTETESEGAQTDPEATPLEKAQLAKNKGNKYFKGGRYDKAIECYTEAIEVCPPGNSKDVATFFQNRAAAYEQLKNNAKVIEDCSEALNMNDRYVKALFRRAKAYENTGQLTECLEDVTAVCILESFSNQTSLLMADRVLKELGRSKAKKEYLTRKPVTPSPQFIRTYFMAFTNDPFINTLADVDSEDPTDDTVPKESAELEKHDDENTEKGHIEQVEKPSQSAFKLAKAEFRASKYDDVVNLCTKELELGEDSVYWGEALLLRATFYLLRGEGNKATIDLNTLLQNTNVNKRIRSNALIKRGSLKMQNGEQNEALKDFEMAIKEDPENSDIYHHRGQLNLLIEKVEEAVHDFKKSVSLSPNFPIAHVQKCYTEYRLAFTTHNPMQIQNAITEFEKTIDRFSECAEGYALYGQALCDQQMYQKADDNFKRALEIEPDNGNLNVHRGLLRLQWTQNIEEAASFINKALEIDDRCEFAYETLGTIEVQRGNLTRAVELFTKAINLAKTEVEMAHLFSLLDAAEAQSNVALRYGITPPNLAGL